VDGYFRRRDRKRLALAVTIGLLLMIALTFLTGFVAAALDLNRFAYHKYAAYAAIGLALLHIRLHWRSLTAQIRRWLVSRPTPAVAAAGSSSSRRASAHAARLSRRSFLAPGLALAAGTGIGHLVASRANPLTTLEPGDDLGQIYHQWSIPRYAGLLVKSVRVAPQLPLYKEFPSKPVVPLPAPPEPGGLPWKWLSLGDAPSESTRIGWSRCLSLAACSTTSPALPTGATL
jgi:hypothetical protein